MATRVNGKMNMGRIHMGRIMDLDAVHDVDEMLANVQAIVRHKNMLKMNVKYEGNKAELVLKGSTKEISRILDIVQRQEETKEFLTGSAIDPEKDWSS